MAASVNPRRLKFPVSAHINKHTFGRLVVYADAKNRMRKFKVHVHITQSGLFSVSYKYTHCDLPGEVWTCAYHHRSLKSLLTAISVQAKGQGMPDSEVKALALGAWCHFEAVREANLT